ncbi:MAG: sodium:solute symporter family protein, partial [Rubricoccaceae bacterium]|nr:sodium:solute symporter family protein [Rubricoccaceae bacterium]
MAPLDWFLVGLYLVVSFGIAVYYARRGSRSTAEFFASGRAMPWWLAGTSMVATTFAADTPLAVTELVAQSGISGNWLWWSAALGGVLTVIFFARLWRRSGVLTDVELVELRYAGRAAAALRGVKAVYFGLFMNAAIIGWVALAMETVLDVLFPGMRLFGQASFSLLGLEVGAPLATVGLLLLLTAAYALLSGLWGITVTDAFQFVMAMTGAVALAWFALDLPEIGGLGGLVARLPPETFRFFPTVGREAAEVAGVLALSGPAIVAFLGVQWWASWYPGAEPGGGGYVAQRMLSTRSERDSVLATLWFTVAHYAVRPWPWIIVALCALVLYPGLDDAREGYVLVMRETLPPGLLGLLFAAFLAAFMSTISTQLNWGTSYLVHDLYRRFVRRGASERHYVAASRLVTFGLAVVGFLVATQLDSISGTWGLILSASAGLGLVLILRWYWWRVNAWSELTATLVPLLLVALQLVGTALGTTGPDGTAEPLFAVPFLLDAFPYNLFGVTALTTAAWLLATFLTPPTAAPTVDAFYRRVRPPGPGWRRVARSHPDVRPDDHLGRLAVRWLLGCLLVYAFLFGTGWLLFGRAALGLAALLAAVHLLAGLLRDLRKESPHES